MSAIGFYVFFVIAWVVTLLPLRVLYVLSDFFFVLSFYVFKYRKKVVLENLHNSFPEKSEKEINEIARKYYRHLCDVSFETAKMINMSQKQMAKRCKFINPEIFDDLYKEGRSAIGIIGHYCNWEWFVCLAPLTKFVPLAIYKPISNKYFNNYMIKIREKFGPQLVSMNQALRIMLKYRQDQKQTLTFFIADQTPTKNEIQYWINFLNQDTPVFMGTERIARKTNQAVVYCKMKKVKRGYYETEFHVLCLDPSQTEEYEITKLHIKALEETIIEKPEYWLWSHKRWKHKRVLPLL